MIVTRFAPSPTGYLHIGGLRTALFNWLWARKNHGKFLLRIEDTDLSRNSQEAAEAIIQAFKWVGLEFDGEITYQSNRFDLYKTYIQKLLDEGKAYYCYMTKEELDALRAEQMARKERPRYDGRYRDGKLPPREGVAPVVRIKAPLEGTIDFYDGVKGAMKFAANEIDDFIIARADGTPTYNFVVAIDDALMGVTDVIRGDDHLSNTPKQIIVYEALGFTIPRFFHLPMINNPQGKKLSKRDGATDVMEYQRMGYLPEALLNFLVRLGWSHGDQEIFSMQEMLEYFDPADINKSASSYNADKLLWLNSHYIKNVSNERLLSALEDLGCSIKGYDKAHIILDATKERAKTLLDIKSQAQGLLKRPEHYDETAWSKFINADSIMMLELFVDRMKEWKEPLHLPTDWQALVEAFLTDHAIKIAKLAQPMRVALTGTSVSPGLYETLCVIGQDEISERIARAAAHFRKQAS
ncbi:MAG: glutamate--tRNA ligase [Campylobacterales bacterium]